MDFRCYPLQGIAVEANLKAVDFSGETCRVRRTAGVGIWGTHQGIRGDRGDDGAAKHV